MKKLLMIMAMVSVIAMAGVANADVLDLSSAPWGMSSIGWGLSGNLAFDNNLGTYCATDPGIKIAPLGSTPAWLRVDLGQDYELNSVSINMTGVIAVDYTVRVLGAGGAGSEGNPAAYTTIGTAVGLNNVEVGNPRSEAWEVWDFAAGTVAVPGGTPPGTAVVDITDPIGRYLMLHYTMAGDNIWGCVMTYEIDVDGDVPIPEPAGLGLLGVALLAVRRKRS